MGLIRKSAFGSVTILIGWLFLACSGDDKPKAAAPNAGDAGVETVDASTAPDAAYTDDVPGDVARIHAESGLPALAGAVFENGELLGIGAAGVRKEGDPTRVTVEDVWHLGSCTKAMTATLVGMFVQEGKLAWTDKLGKVFPDATVHASFAETTIDDLLNHTGGFDHDVPDGQWQDMWDAAAKDEAPEVTRKRVIYATIALAAPNPRGTYNYSNAGFMAAGAALEHIAGKSWEALMTERVFGPLGMTSCGFGPAGKSGVDQPWGHEGTQTPFKPIAPTSLESDNPKSLGPAGTVHCSLSDWAKFLTEHVKGSRGESTLAPKAIFEHLHTASPAEDYGGGWIIAQRSWADGLALSHEGSNTLNLAVTWVAPTNGLVLVAVTNAAPDSASETLDDLVGAMLDRAVK